MLTANEGMNSFFFSLAARNLRAKLMVPSGVIFSVPTHHSAEILQVLHPSALTEWTGRETAQAQLSHPHSEPLTVTLESSMALTKVSESMEAERMVSVRPR